MSAPASPSSPMTPGSPTFGAGIDESRQDTDGEAPLTDADTAICQALAAPIVEVLTDLFDAATAATFIEKYGAAALERLPLILGARCRSFPRGWLQGAEEEGGARADVIVVCLQEVDMSFFVMALPLTAAGRSRRTALDAEMGSTFVRHSFKQTMGNALALFIRASKKDKFDDRERVEHVNLGFLGGAMPNKSAQCAFSVLKNADGTLSSHVFFFQNFHLKNGVQEVQTRIHQLTVAAALN